MPRTIDLNCDMGESFGSFTIGADAAMMPVITSANLACGFHGGDPHVMRASVELCRRHGVAIGAHPGFPDLLGFGRRNLAATPAQVRDFVTYQVGALHAFVTAAGLRLQHVKPHGALYMMALIDDALSTAIAEAVATHDPKLAIFTTVETATERAAHRAGLRVVREFFADRSMTRTGWQMFGSRLEDLGETPEAIARRAVRAVVQGQVETREGGEVAIEAETICVHSDTPGAQAVMGAIREALEEAGVSIGPPV